MNIQAFRIFCDLVELKNFSRTAQKHSLSQSAISQQLAQLESLHNCQLINRKKRPLNTTSAGEMYYHAAKDIIERYDKLSSDIKSMARPSSVIYLAAIYSIGMHTLQPYVAKFISKYPRVKLTIEYLSSKVIREGVLNGDIDFGVVALPRKDKNLMVYPFVNEPMCVICSPSNALAERESINVHSLDRLEFIGFEENVPTRIYLDTFLRHYRTRPQIIMEFDNIETIKRAVEIGAGISILPLTTVKTELASGALKSIEISDEALVRPTGLLVRKNKILSQSGKYLIELLGKTLNEH